MEWFNLGDSINQIALIGAVAILALTIFVVGGYIKKMKDSKADGDLTNEDWDGIREFKNDIPIGWGISYLVLLIWGLWYWFVGYPLNAYSQIGEYNEEVKAYNVKFESKWNNADTETLTKMGQNLYLVQCSQCHGITTEGINGVAANLLEWGREEGIVYTLQHGSKGLGYALGDMLPIAEVAPGIADDDESKKAIAAYVMAELSEVKKTKYPELVDKGRELYVSATCIACHGDDGKGMGGLAPDLTKYGTPAFVAEVLEKGKNGHIGNMPSFKSQMLTDIQKEALGHFIYSDKN
ncbi:MULTISPECIES: c-type cytochrome [Helicobacter]|uniref:Cytochrome c oxidase subunit III n=1 Tax=Helicobacter ibis TaxID=2962633 RepID=A0ABT4VE91_9HELI|nr:MULTISPECIES: c-type cytochrome [Helicobacter]MDA3967612.1 c-type cytochrome [Helicobacter sp. WB40]MDA3968366.1 c-type cytochrome [Helicobacter ibis]